MPYEKPVLRDLGRMDVVTQKTFGPGDGDGGFQGDQSWSEFCCQYPIWLSWCCSDPGASSSSSGGFST